MRTETDSLRYGQLAFVGRMMAGVSHEFKNHLAVIRELGGLLSDLLTTEKAGQSAHRERYHRIIADIDERVLLAAEMCRFFSRFSHRMDQPVVAFDVNEILAEELYLLNRFARQKMIEVDFFQQSDLPSLVNDPSLLQFAVFCIIYPYFGWLERNGRIMITTSSPPDGGVRLEIRCEGPWKDAGPELDFQPEIHLPEIVQKLGAALDPFLLRHPLREIVLTVPSKPLA